MRDAILTVRLLCVLAVGLSMGVFLRGFHMIGTWAQTFVPGISIVKVDLSGERTSVDRWMPWLIATAVILLIVVGVARDSRRLARNLLSMR